MSNKLTLDSEGQEQVALASIGPLKGIAIKALDLAEDIFSNRISYDPWVGADQMSLSFLTKQCEHLRSVHLLLKGSVHRDAILVARTMYEGDVILRWAFACVPDRPDLWFWHGAIADWRQIQKNEQNGRPVDETEKQELKKYVDQYGNNYLKKTVRQQITAAQASNSDYKLPGDPWTRDWTEISVATMSNEIESSDLYDSFYRRSSEWVHWAPRSVLQATQFVSWGTDGFKPFDWQTASQALAAGCQALLNTLEITDKHFSLGREQEIQKLQSELINSLNQILKDFSIRGNL